MTDVAKTIAMIRAGGAARTTRSELLDLCDAAEHATAGPLGPPLGPLDDESECSHGVHGPWCRAASRDAAIALDAARAATDRSTRELVAAEAERDRAHAAADRWAQRVRELEARIERVLAAAEGRQ